MSGPIQRPDLECVDEVLAGIEIREGRRASVGGLDVVRVLPTKGRRTVGAWCFVDLAGPADAEQPDPMEVGPHPHIGLSTVTWLLEGEALHTDSLGTEQVIRPGQLNLMTAGHGIAHAELAAQPPFRGVQLWVAQPEATRHGASAFEHHEQLPGVELDGGEAVLLVGELDGQRAPTRADTELLGAQLELTAETTVLGVAPHHEHAVVPLDGRVRVGAEVIEPGWLALIPAGIDEVPIDTRDRGARLLLLGGEPLGEPIQMWWNFVARDRAEIEEAFHAWQQRTDRFGDVTSSLDRIEAPRPPWMGAGRRG
jgi:quercetin 2,3-dioxygenase